MTFLPLSMWGLAITRVTNFLIFAFRASRHDTLELQHCLIADCNLPLTDLTLITAMDCAPTKVRHAFSHLATGDGAPVVPSPLPSTQVGPLSRGYCSRRLGRVMTSCNEDSVSVTTLS